MLEVSINVEKLRQIEWAGHNCGCPCCPVCWGVDPSSLPKDHALGPKYGHKKGCWLGELLEREEWEE